MVAAGAVVVAMSTPSYRYVGFVLAQTAGADNWGHRPHMNHLNTDLNSHARNATHAARAAFAILMAYSTSSAGWAASARRASASASGG